MAGRVLDCGDQSSAGLIRRSNAEWIAALDGTGDAQAAALIDLRTHLLRAALFTLQRALHYVGHLESSIVGELAQDCAQEALTAILQHLRSFRGESRFTTWAYAFAVNTALVTARRERRAYLALDRTVDGADWPPTAARDDDGPPDPERSALQAEMMAAIRDAIERHLSFKQQRVLRALVFEGVPLDVVVRRWGSNRNAVYKLVHDARRKLKKALVARGFDVEEFLGVSRSTRGRRRSMTSAAFVGPLRVAAR